MANDTRPAPGPERFLHCPACHAVAAREDTLGRTVVYMRCAACGETWTIPERRRGGRDAARTPRFVPPRR